MTQQFIDPLTLSRVKDLPLVAKTVARGFLHGLHTSMQRGSGIEFSQYRIYEPGDELAKIDWKLFARSDRYFVREAERESNINVWLVLDASASMLQISEGSAKQGGWNKLDYARYLLATIAYIAQQQGDAVGLVGISTDQVHYLPVNAGQRHWQKLVLQLAKMESGGRFPDPSILQAQIGRMRSNGLVFVISDFYQRDSEIVDFIGKLSNRNTDVVGVQLTSKDEEEFPYSGSIRFEDLETHRQIQVSAKQVKQDYLSVRQDFEQALIEQLSARSIQHLKANIDQPLDQTLFDFLNARKKVL